MNKIFRTKSVNEYLDNYKKNELRQSLGLWALIALGVGTVIGAGIFSITGIAAGEHAGPAIIISFILAGIAASFAALCYCEFATMIPVSGSAYSYAYATLGEIIAFIIGWDLVLEYSLASAFISISWSQYFNKLLSNLFFTLPDYMLKTPFEGGFFNFPAAAIIILLSVLLIKGIKESAIFNNFLVIIKLLVILIFIGIGWFFIDDINHVPFIPDRIDGKYGYTGIFAGASMVFIAYLGFDAISTASQEVKNPNKNIPLGILGTLIISTILYVLFSYVMTGLVNYKEFINNSSPAATAFAKTGFSGLNIIMIIAILTGLTSGVLMTLLAQSRIFYAMSKDGLLPRLFGNVHDRFKTPWKTNLFFMIAISILAGFIPIKSISHLVSFGTLVAFAIVCISIVILRKKYPDIHRPFKVPFYPITPILGSIICVALLFTLPIMIWVTAVLWIMLGVLLYIFYGFKNSKLNNGN